MSEFFCKNCVKPMRVTWDDEQGWIGEHYERGDCAHPEFTNEDAEILDNDYAESPTPPNTKEKP
jgi:hypothetical protein